MIIIVKIIDKKYKIKLRNVFGGTKLLNTTHGIANSYIPYKLDLIMTCVHHK